MKRSLTILTIATLLSANALAQLGNDNPAGISGQYNGNVTTGCSYDPYTGNATRSVTDVVVAGGVGTYPLAFTRTMNSRYVAGMANEFGLAGNWRHSYQWSIDPVTVASSGTKPTSYFVNYPDGRRINFKDRNNGDPNFRGPLGIRDRLFPLKNTGTEVYVILSDGGKVWFHANVSGLNYTFSFMGIIDPYGQRTLISYPADGSLTVTEPAGRTLKLFYRMATSAEGNTSDRVLGKVVASDGRQVLYGYTAYVTPSGARYTALTTVAYFGDANLNASYTYQNGNTDPNDRPLIKTCTDPMYDGPMWKIAYDFAPAGTNTGGGSVVYGQLLREKHPNGTPVSTLTVTAADGRRETRGDNPTGAGNPSRGFAYNTYRLKQVGDFKGVTELTQYDSNYYLKTITDRRGNTTTYDSNELIGCPRAITQPISSDVIPANTASKIGYVYGTADAQDPNNRDPNNPYYLYAIKNGNGTATQFFFRYPTKQIYQINYDPTVGGYNYQENFTYNQFGQILTHTTRRRNIESFEYADPANPSRVTAYRDTEHQTGNPTARYHYDSLGRVDYMTEGRGASLGDANYTTYFAYNLRGQLTRLTHPDGTYIQYAYNPNGTLAWTADERHTGASSDANQRTSYIYDDYKRLRSVTTPLRGPGDSTPRTTTYYYDQNGTGEDYTRTAASPTKILSPGGKVTKTVYDENLRTASVTVVGDANTPDAKTSYVYDANGNVISIKDPNGQSTGKVTAFHYDVQNRPAWMDDPIDTDRNDNGHTKNFYYDPAGNLIREIRADNKMKQYKYDVFGRLRWVWDYGSNCDITLPSCSGTIINEIQYGHDAEDNLSYVYVENGGFKVYDFTYDKLNRKIRASYPANYSGTGRAEIYTYDVANHLSTYTNPAGQVKTLTYDNRGRLTDSSWTNDPTKGSTGPAVHITYDATRPTGISTTAYTVAGVTLPATNLVFGYDEANNRIYEDQTFSNLPTRRVQSLPDADGSRKNLIVSTGSNANFANNFEYTSRNELRTIYNGASGTAQPLFTYSYDASGNATQRLGRTLSGDTTTTGYDALNRPSVCTHAVNGANISTTNYSYTKVGNINAVIRGASPYEDGKGDYFNTYTSTNELLTAIYSATGAADAHPDKSVSYSVLNERRDSMSVTNSVGTTSTTAYVHNDLNQYTKITVNGADRLLQYDTNFNLTSYNGWTYAYDAENRLISADADRHAKFAYDGVGRCVRRIIDSNTTVLTYDQWTPIVEWDGNGNLVATNIYGLGDDEILYRSSGSTQWYYKADPMGNVRFLLNSSGVVIEKYVYDAFGSPTVSNFNGSARTTNRFMFSGREYFTALGLYDLRNRVYDPTMGRFYQIDPIRLAGDPTNLYRFCGNNPLLGGDPTGLQDAVSPGLNISDDSSSFTFSAQPSWLTPSALDEIFGQKYTDDRSDGFFASVARSIGDYISDEIDYGHDLDQAVQRRQQFVSNLSWGERWKYEQPMVPVSWINDPSSHALEIGLTIAQGLLTGRILAAGGAAPRLLPNAVEPWAGEAEVLAVPQDAVAFRIWGGKSEQVGEWLSPTPVRSAAQAKARLALPGGNSAEFMSEVTLPGGTRYQIGTAAPNFGQPGGGIQIQLLERIPPANFGPGVPLPPH